MEFPCKDDVYTLDVCQQIAHTWIGEGNKACFDGFEKHNSETFMLHDSQVMMGVAAMLYERYGGPQWVKHCRLLNVGASSLHPSNAGHMVLQSMHNEPPTLGIAILRSMAHTMVVVHTGDEIICVDGKDPQCTEFTDLAEAAAQQFAALSLPRLKPQNVSIWEQHDNESCGYLVLDFLRHVLFKSSLGAADIDDYEEPKGQEAQQERWQHLGRFLDQLILKHNIWHRAKASNLQAIQQVFQGD